MSVGHDEDFDLDLAPMTFLPGKRHSDDSSSDSSCSESDFNRNKPLPAPPKSISHHISNISTSTLSSYASTSSRSSMLTPITPISSTSVALKIQTHTRSRHPSVVSLTGGYHLPTPAASPTIATASIGRAPLQRFNDPDNGGARMQVRRYASAGNLLSRSGSRRTRSGSRSASGSGSPLHLQRSYSDEHWLPSSPTLSSTSPTRNRFRAGFASAVAQMNNKEIEPRSWLCDLDSDDSDDVSQRSDSLSQSKWSPASSVDDLRDKQNRSGLGWGFPKPPKTKAKVRPSAPRNAQHHAAAPAPVLPLALASPSVSPSKFQDDISTQIPNPLGKQRHRSTSLGFIARSTTTNGSMSGAVTQVPPPSPTLPEAKTNLNVKAIAHPNCLTPLHLSLSLSSVTVTCTSTGTDAGKGKSASDSEPSIGIPGPSVHNFDSESKSRVGTSSTKAIAGGSSFFSDPEDETDQGEYEHKENSDMDMDSDLDMDLIAVAAGFDLPVSVSSRTPTPLKTPIDTPMNNTSRSPSWEQAPSLAGVGIDDTRVGRGSYAQVYGFRSLPRSFVHLPSPVPHPSRSLHVHQEARVPRGATPAKLVLGSMMEKGKSQSLISSGDSLPSACARSLPPRLSSAEKSPKTPTPTRPPRSYPPYSTPATNKIQTPTSTSPLALSLSTPGKRPKKSRMSGVISHFTLDSSTSSWAAASLSNTRNDPHIISTSLSNDFVVDPFAKDDGTTMHITTGTRIKPSPSISADTSFPTSSSFNSRGPDPLLEHEQSSTLKKKHRSVGLNLGSLRPPLPRPRRLSTPPPPPSSKGHGWHEKKQNQLYAVYPLMQHL